MRLLGNLVKTYEVCNLVSSVFPKPHHSHPSDQQTEVQREAWQELVNQRWSM